MKSVRIAAAAALITAFFQAALAWADAEELSIRHTVTISAAPEAVWAVAGDFGGAQRWLPGVETSRLVLHSRNETGAIRLLRRRSNGTQVTEKLLDYDPWNMRMAYTYVDGAVGASDYLSVLSVSDAGQGMTLVEWTGKFKRIAYWTDDPPAGQDDKTSLDFLNSAYRTGLANLKKMFEAPE